MRKAFTSRNRRFEKNRIFRKSHFLTLTTYYRLFLTITVILFNEVLSGFEIREQNGMPVISSGNCSKIPLMAVVSDCQMAKSSSGVFQHRSEVYFDVWRNYTRRLFTPPYVIETMMRMESPIISGAGVLFRLPCSRGECLTGLTSMGRLRINDYYWTSHWELGKWIPMKIEVKTDEITIRCGTEHFQRHLKYPIKKGPIGIAIYGATGGWKAIRVSEVAGKILFEELWDGKSTNNWRLANGQKLLQHCKSCGIGIYQVGLDYGGSLLPDGESDFSAFDSRCRSILQLAPEAFLIARLHIANIRSSASVLTLSGDGKPWRRHPWTFSDPRELALQQRFLKEFLTHVEKQSYGKALAGILLMSGDGGEFAYHFTPDGYSDYSQVHAARFREYLKKHYGSIQVLNQAWNSSLHGFSEVTLPTPMERTAREGKSLLFNERTEQRLIDFMEFHSLNIARNINFLAETVKKHSILPRLVGVYYGYTAVATGSVFNKGHNALAEVLRGPIDFIACPYQYRNRNAGHPILFQLPFYSAQLHGKTVFLEDDTRTCFNINPDDPLREKDLDTSREALKRNFLQALSANTGLWYLDFGSDWFAHAELEDIMRQFGKFMEERRKGKFAPCPHEIVALVSEKAINRMRRDHKAVFEPIFRQLADVLGLCGAPFDVALLSDLANLPPYRFYFVLNYPAAPEAERKMVEHLRQKAGSRIFTPKDFRCVPLAEVREKLKNAGVTLFTDNEAAVYGGRNWLGIHTPKTEKELIVHFPADVDKVYKCFSGKFYPLNNNTLTIPIRAGQTRFWTWE